MEPDNYLGGAMIGAPHQRHPDLLVSNQGHCSSEPSGIRAILLLQAQTTFSVRNPYKQLIVHGTQPNYPQVDCKYKQIGTIRAF